VGGRRKKIRGGSITKKRDEKRKGEDEESYMIFSFLL